MTASDPTAAPDATDGAQAQTGDRNAHTGTQPTGALIATASIPRAIPKGADVAEFVRAASERMAELIDSANTVEELWEMRARWESFCTMVNAKRRGGEAKAQAVARRIEVKVGTFLLVGNIPDDCPLTRSEVSELRRLARNPEVVEEVIEQSSNGSPPTRNKCIVACRRRRMEQGELGRSGPKPKSRQRTANKLRRPLRPADATPLATSVGGKTALVYSLIRRALKAHEAIAKPADGAVHSAIGYHLVEAEALTVELLQAERRMTP